MVSRMTAGEAVGVIDPTARVHGTADLEADVTIGRDTAVWHRAQIRTGARVGAETTVGRDVFIDVGVVVGDRVKIQNAALIYHGATIGDGVFIGPGAILTNDRHPRAITPDGALAGTDDWVVSPIRLADGCSIGAGAVVIAGCDVGPFAMVGAGAVVTHPVPGHALVAGNPAQRIGWVCACGSRLYSSDGEPAAADHLRYASDHDLLCQRCGRTYRPAGETLVLAP